MQENKSVLIANLYDDISLFIRKMGVRNPRLGRYQNVLKCIIDFDESLNMDWLSLNSLNEFLKNIYFDNRFDTRGIEVKVVLFIIEYYHLNISDLKKQNCNLICFFNDVNKFWTNDHSRNTLPVIKSITLHFLLFLYFNGFYSLKNIDEKILMKFLNFKSKSNKKISICDKIIKMRWILRLAFELGYIPKDLSYFLYGIKSHNDESLPDTYTDEEITSVIKSIDTFTERGKRQYAIFLTISLLGIRSIDLSLMKISDIDFTEKIIKFVQSKTGEYHILTIPDILLEVLLDYLSIRSDTKSQYLFTHLPKNGLKGKLSKQRITAVVHEAFFNSNIHIEERKSHSHVLRHSLATSLINSQIEMHTVSQILGHTSVESTKIYTKVDIDFLRLLALEVPKNEI